MSVERLELSEDPVEALAELRQASKTGPVVVIKLSSICPVSFWTRKQLKRWLDQRPEDAPLALVELDVIAERALARGLTDELGVRHESPQALVFADGELIWHASHEQLNKQAFIDHVDTRVA